MKGQILTVLGPISPKDLGQTLPHEHLFINFDVAYTKAPESEQHTANELKNQPPTLESLGWIRYFPYSHPSNLHLDSIQDALDEVKAFKASGGNSIVDLTTGGIRTSCCGVSGASGSSSSSETIRNPEALEFVSKQTGVNIVIGAGYYIGASHPSDLESLTISEIAARIVSEISVGVEGTKIKAGVIGEIGCSFPLREGEIKVLKASALAQIQTGAPLIIHPGRNENSPSEIMKILRDAGAITKKTVMSHLDRTIVSYELLKSLVETYDCYLEFDLFGNECSYYQLNEGFDMPSDAQRMDLVIKLVGDGYISRLLISHDIHTKHRFEKYGGHGFSHIFKNIVPRLIRKGLTLSQVHKITVENPTEWLTFQ